MIFLQRFWKKTRIFWVILSAMTVVGLGGRSDLWAQDLTVEAEVNIRQVVIDSFIQLTVTIGGADHVDAVDMPEIEGFQVRYQGESQQSIYVNGRLSRYILHQYSLFPLKVGDFIIPPIKVVIDGKTYQTEPIPVKVVPSASGTSAVSGQAPAGIEDRIFLTLRVPKTEAVVHEQIPVKVFLFVSDIDVRDIQYPTLEAPGFEVEKFQEPQRSQRMIKGRRYFVFAFDTRVTPVRTGDLTLGPVTLTCNRVVRSRRKGSSFGFGGGIFQDDFFDSFFDTYEKVPMTLRSNEAVITVKPLPEDGRPVDFSGAVGKYEFDVSVKPRRLKVGDPMTLRMVVKGQGDLASVRFPQIQDSASFKTYEPTISEEGDKKVLEQVVIPRSAKVKEFPAVSFSYFDPDLGRYRTIRRGPFPLQVEAVGRQEALKVVGAGKVHALTKEKEEDRDLGEDIIYIKDNPGAIRRIGRSFYRRPPFYALVGLWGIGYLGLYGVYLRRRRIQTDSAYARRLKAPRQAREGLRRARRHMTSGETEAFYDTVFKTLQGYLGDRLHLSSGAITFDRVKEELAKKGGGTEVEKLVREIFEACDEVRYASRDDARHRMSEVYTWLEQVIRQLEKMR